MAMEIPSTGPSVIPRSRTLIHQGQGRFILLGVPFPFLSHLGKQPSDTPFSFLGANEAGLEPTLAASGHLLWLGLDPCGWGQLAHPAGSRPREQRGQRTWTGLAGPLSKLLTRRACCCPICLLYVWLPSPPSSDMTV